MPGVYVAHPIDQNHQVTKGLTEVHDFLAESEGVSWVYKPASAFGVGCGPRDPGLKSINDYALSLAEVVIAFLPVGVVTIGVPMEIESAVRLGKQVLIISDAPSWSIMYASGNVEIVSEWGERAQKWVEEALRGPSERIVVSEGLRMPITLSEGAEAPRRGHTDDAGLDLIVSETVTAYPGRFVDVPCGVSVHLPEGTWGLITGRSSTLRKRGLLCAQGVIDAGYRGEMMAGVWNLTPFPVDIKKGDRVAQLIVLPNLTEYTNLEVVAQLEPGSRGLAGFGSTGR